MGDVKIPSRSDWLFGNTFGIDIVKNKDALIRSYATYMLNIVLEMFEYDGLPETVPQKELEILHCVNAFAIWKDVNGKLYVFFGGLGGVLDEYYHPTRAIISNPYLNYSADLEIDKECVITWNDKCRYGLTPMFNKYSTLLAECDISIRFATINSRIPHLISANDDVTKESVETVLKQIWDGDKFGVILNQKLLDRDGTFTSEFGRNTYGNIKDLIELKQYLKSSWFLELGILSNYNMKRETLNSYETTMDDGVLIPLIDNMLQSRQDGLKKVNAMYGTNITVKLSSTWENIRKELENEFKKQETEIKESEQNDGVISSDNSDGGGSDGK